MHRNVDAYKCTKLTYINALVWAIRCAVTSDVSQSTKKRNTAFISQ